MARIITTEELAQRLQQEAAVQFWNVLTDDYFTGEMLPGSERVPVDRVGKHASTLAVPKDAEIIVYCLGPSCPQSGDAARKLTTLGYTNVFAYEGGLEAWKASGRKIVRVSDQKVA